MRIYKKLDEIFRHGSKVKVLRFLFSEKDEHTGRTIADGIGMSASSIYKTLQEMKIEGLITARRKGKAILYKLQESNYIVKKLLEPLFLGEESLYDDIISVVKKAFFQRKHDIVSVSIFGSVARKEETPSSDIDLVIIVEEPGKKAKIDVVIDKLNVFMAEKFQASISPYVLTRLEIRKKYAEKEPIITSILEDNQLIYGEPIERIIA